MLQPYARPIIPKRPAGRTPLERAGESIRSADAMEEWPTNSYPTPQNTEPLPETPPAIPITLPISTMAKPVQIEIYRPCKMSPSTYVHAAVVAYLRKNGCLPDGIYVSLQHLTEYRHEVMFHHGYALPDHFEIAIRGKIESIPMEVGPSYLHVPHNRVICAKFR